MLKQRDDIRLLDITECISRIELFTISMDYVEFKEDIKTQELKVNISTIK